MCSMVKPQPDCGSNWSNHTMWTCKNRLHCQFKAPPLLMPTLVHTCTHTPTYVQLHACAHTRTYSHIHIRYSTCRLRTQTMPTVMASRSSVGSADEITTSITWYR